MSDHLKENSTRLILENSLQGFFYDQLQEFNQKADTPLPNETIFYSSRVMDRLGVSDRYFDTVEEGRVKDKVLGLKLMEVSSMTKRQKRRTLKDIGDTSLLLCGYFSESLNRKIIDTKYYQDLGVLAYQRLDCLVPQLFDIPSFYEQLSNYFGQLTLMISLVSQKNSSQQNDMLLYVANSKALKAS
jgi:hypothetical protein